MKEYIPFYALRTCPVAAENAQDKLLLKMAFLIFQGTVATFLGVVDKSKITFVKFIQDFVYQNL